MSSQNLHFQHDTRRTTEKLQQLSGRGSAIPIFDNSHHKNAQSIDTNM